MNLKKRVLITVRFAGECGLIGLGCLHQSECGAGGESLGERCEKNPLR
jgi:hypothetical protein